MKNNRLLHLLASLERHEFRQFGNFVHSPFLNKNANCILLYDFLLPYYPDFEVDMEHIGIQIFGGEEKAAKNLGSLMTAMVGLLMDFLVYMQLQQDEDTRNNLLLKSLSGRGQKTLFLQKYKQLVFDAPKSPFLDIAYWADNYEKLSILQAFNLLYRDQTYPLNLLDVAQSFEKYSLLNQLHITAIILNKARFEKIAYTPQDITGLLQLAQDKGIMQDSVGALYVHTVRLLLNDEADESFVAIKQGLYSAKDKVAADERYNFYNFAHSYCNRQVQKGRLEFRREAFVLYQQRLEENMLSLNKYIEANHIRNIVILGLGCDESEWVYDFIEKYKDAVLPEYRNDLYDLNKATYFFQKKDYAACCHSLVRIEKFMSPHYHLEAKAILLKVYYEQKEGEAFDSLVHSFKALINYHKKNKQLSEVRAIAYLNFIRLADSLFEQHIRLKPALGEIKKIATKLHDCDNVTDRQWLSDKLRCVAPILNVGTNFTG